ncbi:MAG TPA: DUF4230 domain-containing protein [Erysipelotrichaceae bacterium]|nr:DUF4230 domain-containing protein [Erysipelotrichaceae bacterium]
MKKLIGVVLLFVFLTFVFLFLSNSGLLKITSNKESETSLMQERLVELSEWTTLRYEYSNVIISRTDKTLTVLGADINFAETIKLIEYSGYLKAGTDMSKVQISYDSNLKKISARVPRSKILDNVVDTNSAKVEDVTGNIFSDYPTQIIFDEINANKKQLEEEKISQGFLDEADKRIEQLLTSFLLANGYEIVEIEFY